MSDLSSIIEVIGFLIVPFIVVILEITSSEFKGFFKRLDFMKNLILRISEKDKDFEKFMKHVYDLRLILECSLFSIIILIMIRFYSPQEAPNLIFSLGFGLMFLLIIRDAISFNFLFKKTNKSLRKLSFLIALSPSRINEIINSLIITYTGIIYLFQETISHNLNIINFLIGEIVIMISIQFYVEIIGLIHIFNPFEKHLFSIKRESLAINTYLKNKGGNFLVQVSVGLSNGIVVTGYIEHTDTQLVLLKKDENELVYIPWSSITYYSFHLN